MRTSMEHQSEAPAPAPPGDAAWERCAVMSLEQSEAEALDPPLYARHGVRRAP